MYASLTSARTVNTSSSRRFRVISCMTPTPILLSPRETDRRSSLAPDSTPCWESFSNRRRWMCRGMSWSDVVTDCSGAEAGIPRMNEIGATMVRRELKRIHWSEVSNTVRRTFLVPMTANFHASIRRGVWISVVSFLYQRSAGFFQEREEYLL